MSGMVHHPNTGIESDPLADEMMNIEPALTREILELLSMPFPEDAIGWKPQAFNRDKTRALAVPHHTSRHVMDRLDAVVGPAGWETDFEYVPGIKAVKLALSVLGITKCDMGFVEGDDDAAIKGSVSDALKRAGVLFGIGRYLYGAEPQWVGWDNARREFTEQPRLKFAQDTAPPPLKAEPPTQGVKHWIEYKNARKRFWAWTSQALGLSDDEVHTALGVEHIREYAGPMSKAKAQIENWVANQINQGQEDIPF